MGDKLSVGGGCVCCNGLIISTVYSLILDRFDI